jgi:hypothetical protein
MMSPCTAKCIYQKYNSLPEIIKSLEPSEVSLILKSQRNLYAFYPRLGLFSTDFAVAYCNNLHSNKSRSRQKPTKSDSKEDRKRKRKHIDSLSVQ